MTPLFHRYTDPLIGRPTSPEEEGDSGGRPLASGQGPADWRAALKMGKAERLNAPWSYVP
jgi:hypothetical protein